MNLSFRSLKPIDIPAVLSIEQASNPNAWEQSKLKSALLTLPSFILQNNQKIVAVIIVQIAIDQADIVHVVRDIEYIGQGFGKRIIDELLVDLKLQKIEAVFLEVRETNIIAQNCYKKLGFVEAGIRKAYYFDREDAMCMKKSL